MVGSEKADEVETVFLMSCGRSGSTLLQAVMNRMDGVTVRGENDLALAPLVESWVRVRDAKELFGKDYNQSNQPWHGIEDIDTDAYARALAATFVQHVLRPSPEDRVIGHKEIRYNNLGGRFALVADFILKYFNKAKIVIIMRNAADVASSGWFKSEEQQQTLAMVADMDRKFTALASSFPDKVFITRYEDFIVGPEESFRLARFLGTSISAAEATKALAHRLSH